MAANNPIPETLLVPPGTSRSDFRVRLVKQSDLIPVHRAFFAHLTLASFQAQYRRALDRQLKGRFYWLVAEADDQLIGHGQLVAYPSGAEIANLAVLETHQNQGVGTAVIEILIAVARHIGLASLEIGVTSSNERALALYRRLGFVDDRQLKLAQGEPAIILYKSL